MDLKNNSLTLPHEIYEKSLKDILQKESNEQYEIIYSHGSTAGDNYIGIIYRIQALDKKKKSSILKLIVKLPPQNFVRRSQFLIHECFIREATFYDKIYPIYEKFQAEKGINVKLDGFHHIARCYKSLTEEPYEALFLQDLNDYGFEMYDRLKEPTREHVLLVMRTLAKFHAIFFCIREENPELIKPYTIVQDYFVTQFKRENSPFSKWFEGLKFRAIDVINKCGSDKIVKRVQSFLAENITELYESCLNRDATEPYAILCHGDCWNNNIMYRNDEHGTPVDIRLLDFQLVKYASPVTDVLYYIFTCTSKSLRDRHYQEFLDIYYQTLSEFIVRLGFNPETLFPRDTFNDHLKKFGKFGLIKAVLFLRAFTSGSDEVADIDDVCDKMQKSMEEKSKDNIAGDIGKFSSLYVERLIGVCEDMCDLGYI